LADKKWANSTVLPIQQEVMAEIVNYLAPLVCNKALMFGTHSAIS
jgi:flagellar assembly factor FliW